jgi:hypothetical protein
MVLADVGMLPDAAFHMSSWIDPEAFAINVMPVIIPAKGQMKNPGCSPVDIADDPPFRRNWPLRKMPAPRSIGKPRSLYFIYLYPIVCD